MKDAEKSIECNPNNEKFKYRKARCIGYLGNDEEAIQQLTNLATTPDIAEALEVFQERVRQKQGQYNYHKLLLKYKEVRDKYNMEIAEYTGPIEAKVVEGRGRGLFATQDIAAGTLVMVEKAFSLTGKNKDRRFDLDQALIFLVSPEVVHLVRNTLVEILNNPEKEDLIDLIFNGRNGDVEVDLNNLHQSAKNITDEEKKFKFDDVGKVIRLN